MKQLGLFYWEKRYDRIDKEKDLPMKMNRVVDWEAFRELLRKVSEKECKSNEGSKPYDVVMMFKAIIIQSLYNFSDYEMEYHILDRLTFVRFLVLGLGDYSWQKAEPSGNDLSSNSNQRYLSHNRTTCIIM